MVIPEEQAEIVGGAPVTGRLHADSGAAGGALSCQRIMLTGGASGAAPHHRNRSSELFCIASRAAELSAGGPVISAHQGDLLVVPPGLCVHVRGHRDCAARLASRATMRQTRWHSHIRPREKVNNP